MIDFILTVDLSNKTASITDRDGRLIEAWSQVTRWGAVHLAKEAGWHPTEVWSLTSPPDGFWCPIHPSTPGQDQT